MQLYFKKIMQTEKQKDNKLYSVKETIVWKTKKCDKLGRREHNSQRLKIKVFQPFQCHFLLCHLSKEHLGFALQQSVNSIQY